MFHGRAELVLTDELGHLMFYESHILQGLALLVYNHMSYGSRVVVGLLLRWHEVFEGHVLDSLSRSNMLACPSCQNRSAGRKSPYRTLLGADGATGKCEHERRESRRTPRRDSPRDRDQLRDSPWLALSRFLQFPLKSTIEYGRE